MSCVAQIYPRMSACGLGFGIDGVYLAVRVRVGAPHRRALVLEYLDVIDMRQRTQKCLLLDPCHNHLLDGLLGHHGHRLVVSRREANHTGLALDALHTEELVHQLRDCRVAGYHKRCSCSCRMRMAGRYTLLELRFLCTVGLVAIDCREVVGKDKGAGIVGIFGAVYPGVVGTRLPPPSR
jgi:hypothetical protein